jgi:uncharacterized protein (DUF1800 family)
MDLRFLRRLVLLTVAFLPALLSQQPSPDEAARFLEQATFGPNATLIAHVQQVGFQGFLNEQFALPATSYPNLPLQPTTVPMTCTGTCVRDNYTMYPLQVTFFRNALTAPDQLRQRVSFALQQIFVTSGLTVTQPSWMTPYLQIFDLDAFGNFRQLLSDITLNPAMGAYLNMAGNTKNAPNENYGREILQLFSIGVNLLSADGSPVKNSSGQVVPSYTQAIVDAFSRVFTGWNLVTAGQIQGVPDYIDPMVVNATLHDGGAKTLLNGVTLVATSPTTVATANADLSAALDNIFNHQNVGPFIGRNLIEHLVTSNPSLAYIRRITAVFDDNGSGVRGDLKAVIQAILMDPEARNAPNATFGHLQEPILFKARLLRAFNTSAATTDFVLSDSYLPTELIMGQDLFRSPSVFNYYPPLFSIPGASGVNGPEFAIQSTSTALARVNFVGETTYKTMSISSPNRPTGTWLDLSSVASSAGSTFKLVNMLNNLMLNGNMSPDLQATVNVALAQMSNATNMAKAQRAVYLIGSSPEYFVER